MNNFLIVLDINNTLLTKIQARDKDNYEKLKGRGLYKIKNHFLLKRPFTDLFVDFLNSHHLQYVIWSTALRKNVENMVVYLREIGYNYLGFLSQEECEEGDCPLMKSKNYVKNLEVASLKFRKRVEDCVLVDDNWEKRVQGQNYIKIEEIDPFGEDTELVRVGFEIDKFVGCKEECEMKRVYYDLFENKEFN